MATAICLSLTAAFAAFAAVLLLLSFHREDGLLGLAGMSAMILAAIPAAVYAAITN